MQEDAEAVQQQSVSAGPSSLGGTFVAISENDLTPVQKKNRKLAADTGTGQPGAQESKSNLLVTQVEDRTDTYEAQRQDANEGPSMLEVVADDGASSCGSDLFSIDSAYLEQVVHEVSDSGEEDAIAVQQQAVSAGPSLLGGSDLLLRPREEHATLESCGIGQPLHTK